MTETDLDKRRLGRRELIAGGLVAGAALGVVASGEAHAEGAADASGTASAPGFQTEGSPVATTIAGPLTKGYVYRHAHMFDFTPEGSASNRAWGGAGCYTAGSASTLWASVEIPGGALVREIEWYVRNTSSSPRTAIGRLWAAGTGTLGAVVADVAIPGGSTAIQAVRAVVTEPNRGPYPSGTRLALGLFTETNASIQVNGVRVGFSNGGGELFVLPTPTLAYNSRTTGGKLAANTGRLVTLPAGAAPIGTVGAVALVTLTGGSAGGEFTIWSGGSTIPKAPQIYFGSAPTAAEVTIPMRADRGVNIRSNRAVHVRIDMVARIA